MPYYSVLPKDDEIKQLYLAGTSVRKIMREVDLGYSVVWGRISRMVRDGEISRRKPAPERTFGEELRLQRLAAEAIRAKGKSHERHCD